MEESNPWDGDVAPRHQPQPELVASAYASSQASPLVQKTDYLRPGFDRPAALISVTRKSASPEAAAAVAMLRQPLTARTAILASIIVGSPRALAE